MFKSASEDFFVDALDLDIHLDCGDAFRRTCDFEVHIAEEVFKTLDVGEHCDFVALFVLDKSHCDTCDGCFDGNACVHKCERAAANGRLRSRTVGAQNVGYRADCVGELLFGRKHGFESAFCKCAVSDFTTTGALESLCFACGVTGHVVLMHVSLVVIVVKTFELLSFAYRAESASGESLSLSSCEHCATVNAREHTHFAPDRTNFGELSAVGTHAAFENLCTHFFFLEIVEAVEDEFGFLGLVAEVVCKVSKHVNVESVFSFFSLIAVKRFEDVVHFFVCVRSNSFVDVVGDMFEIHIEFGLADFFLDFFDESHNLFDLFVTEHDCAEHFFFGDDVCARFNHHDGVFRAAEVESKARFCALCAVGIDDVLAVHHADHNRTRRTCPRNVAYRKCDGRTDHAENFGRNVGVNAQNGCNDRNVVVKSLREERTNRSVDKTRSEDRFVACSALSLFESAGDFADCVHFLFVVNAQREKVHTVAGCFAHRCVDHNHGVAATHDARTVGLSAVCACFDGHFSAAYRCLENSFFHKISPSGNSVIPVLSAKAVYFFIFTARLCDYSKKNGCS